MKRAVIECIGPLIEKQWLVQIIKLFYQRKIDLDNYYHYIQ